MSPVCLVPACDRAPAVAASFRISGTPSRSVHPSGTPFRWLLCDEHAVMLHNPDLPQWFEVDHFRPVSILPTERRGLMNPA